MGRSNGQGIVTIATAKARYKMWNSYLTFEFKYNISRKTNTKLFPGAKNTYVTTFVYPFVTFSMVIHKCENLKL